MNSLSPLFVNLSKRKVFDKRHANRVFESIVSIDAATLNKSAVAFNIPQAAGVHRGFNAPAEGGNFKMQQTVVTFIPCGSDFGEVCPDRFGECVAIQSFRLAHWRE